MPIIEPEVSIKSPDKAGAEQLLKAAILTRTRSSPGRPGRMLKLTLPEQDRFLPRARQAPARAESGRAIGRLLA